MEGLQSTFTHTKNKKIWKSFAVIEKSKNLFFGSINFLRRKRQKHHASFQVNLTKNETSNVQNEEINLNSVLSDLFTTDLGRLRKMNVVERLYVTPSRFNSYKQTAANQVLMELTMLFTFSCIFHNLSTYSIGQLFARSTFIKWDTCARNEIYDTRSVCKKCESERASEVCMRSVNPVRCSMPLRKIVTVSTGNIYTMYDFLLSFVCYYIILFGVVAVALVCYRILLETNYKYH